ncbi:glucan biosynthesis protein [Thalassospira marina]|uniref:Glucan biosynthesis protein D n=1 Tax=Thalassospira marina TaxID=2048283 RepID=A0A2N3KZ28_9PROT|nr:glucan biosynthesis protein D [Thalassospira marina]PKR55778.1 glucan biosynthesis protein D [Thalassospira marina]
MDTSAQRRQFLKSAAAAGLVLPGMSLWQQAFAADAVKKLELGKKQKFSFDALVERARKMAAKPYVAPKTPDKAILEQIDYAEHGKLKYKRDFAPFSDGSGTYPVTYFHMGQFFQKPVHMFLLEDGKSQEVKYKTDYFDMPADSPARKLSENIGFAGFRLHEDIHRDDWKTQDWVAFLGASYFRAIGDEGQYGLSARGIAINTATPQGEEFPDFTEFYIEPAKSAEDPVTVYALLDGPSITGAYRFYLTRGNGVTMDVEKFLFIRKDIERFGVAPLTSMFWYSEQNRPFRMDWRPEVHDSDGLALWTGGGERIWRQLNNPEFTRASAFGDDNPRGFGLMQRDRDVSHYLDGVLYHRRPSLWVEPLGAWGKGAVQLVEIPTDDEIHDNIAAFWVPEAPAKAGQSYNFRYRLYWQAHNPYPLEKLAYAKATRLGRGGQEGLPRPKGLTKFVVDFEGDILGTLAYGEYPEAIISVSRGKLSRIKTEPIPDTRLWRAIFDLEVEGNDPVDMRMYLKRGDAPLSETWMFQHLPGLKNWDSN